MIRAVLLSMMLTTPAMACAVRDEFFLADIASHPVVVLADVAGYAFDIREGGRLQLDVVEVWKGNAPDHLTAVWEHGMSDYPPADWDTLPTRIIAALSPGDGDAFTLVVEICGTAHFVDATEANAAAVKAALP